MRIVLAAALLTLLTGTASAQKKGKAVKACGITAIPLAVGNQWVYEPVAHPTPLDPAQTKMLPVQPSKVTITVDAVETEGETTTVQLTELVEIPAADQKLQKTVQSTITCTKDALSISPESFWYSGEPGGFWNVQLEGLERTGHTLPITKGKVSGSEWHDDLKATFKRTPLKGEANLGAGTIDLSRRVVFVDNELIVTVAGQFRGAAKVGVETKGEIAIQDATGKPYVLPEGLVSFLWIADGTGVVQVHNSFVHAYQLTQVTLAK